MKKTVIQIVDRTEKDRNYQFYLLICLLLLFLQFVLSLILGSVKIPTKDVLSLFIGRKFENYEIVVYLRLPRILVSIIVGANLAVSGVLLQAVMRNPLVDPGITGVSSGASIFAIIVMLYFPDYLYFLPIISFFGGLLASVLVYLVAWKNGLSPVRIVLSGIAINA
ncbi:MAG: iron chelate uptake ABC transporter family permease subunit, partial [Fervidobacterium sp.]